MLGTLWSQRVSFLLSRWREDFSGHLRAPGPICLPVAYLQEAACHIPGHPPTRQVSTALSCPALPMPLPLVPSSRHGVYPQVPALRHGAGHHGCGDLCHRAQHPLPNTQYPRAVRGSQEGEGLSKVGSQGLARRGSENDGYTEMYEPQKPWSCGAEKGPGFDPRPHSTLKNQGPVSGSVGWSICHQA